MPLVPLSCPMSPRSLGTVTARLPGRQWQAAFLVAVALAALAILKHEWLQSTAWDLGIFEQYCWLISHRYPPISTLNSGVSAFADHKAYILYPLALVYAPLSSPWALLALQALALAGSGLIVRGISEHLGHDAGVQWIAMAAWWLYPTTFALAMCNFHPDALAVPALLGMMSCAITQKWRSYLACLVVALGCKDVMAFTVVGVGAWLWIVGHRRMGAASAGIALAWFCVALWICPSSSTHSSHVTRYAYLGHSVPEAFSRIAHDPQILWSQDTLAGWALYLGALLLPVAPWMWRASFLPMLPALPHLVLNLLSSTKVQRDISFQYSAGIAPFVVFGALHGMPSSLDRLRHRFVQGLIVVGAFLWLAPWEPFFGRYLTRRDLRAPAEEAFREIGPTERVLTASYLATHIARRPVIDVPRDFVPGRLQGFDVLLVSESDPGDAAEPGAVPRYLEEARRLGWICRDIANGALVSCRRAPGAITGGDGPHAQGAGGAREMTPLLSS